MANLVMSTAGAHFSADRRYRYLLWRVWEKEGPIVMFDGLNASKADEKADDPTIRRCVGFAKAWNYSGMLMGNIFGLVSTDPKALKTHPHPIGENSDRFLQVWGERADKVVACWGAMGEYQGRGDHVLGLLDRIGLEVFTFGLTQNGQPRHPLYLRSDAQLQLMEA